MSDFSLNMNHGTSGGNSELKQSQKDIQLNSKIDWDGLRRRSVQPGGFGADRSDIWPKLLNVKTPLATRNSVVNDSRAGHGAEDDGNDRESRMDASKPNATESVADHKDEYQIRLDTDRSFVLYPGESDPGIDKDQLKAELNNLIVSVFRNRPKLNYFQGYHDIMSVVYLTLPQELQLACAEKLSLQRLRDSMLHSLEPVLGLLRVLKNLLRLVDPEYAKLLIRDSPLPFYALSNLLTLFSHDMPTLPLIQHVFDYLLCRPPIAVVYLATAVLLSRKDYIQSLEGQLEPFMLHPILSTLPPLSEGYEKPPDSQDGYISFPSSPDVKKESEDKLLQGSRQPVIDSMPNPDIKVEVTGDDNNIIKQEPPGSSSIFDGTVPIKAPTPDPTKPEPPDDDIIPPNAPPPFKLETKPEHNPLALSLEIDIPLPATPIPLPTILAHSDSLLAQYPPSHPLLRLSSIMGPQSVVFTWSENFSDLPSDTTAEAMICRPELVVYPVGPDEMEGSDHDEDEGDEESESESESEYGDKRPSRKSMRRRKTGKEGDKGGTLRKRTRRKTIKRKVQKLLKIFGTTAAAGNQNMTHVDGRTMVAGAVLVLGVAIAIYGIKAQDGSLGPGGSTAGIGLGLEAGLNMLGGNRHGLQDELKKIASVLVGVGAKFLHLTDGPMGGGR